MKPQSADERAMTLAALRAAKAYKYGDIDRVIELLMPLSTANPELPDIALILGTLLAVTGRTAEGLKLLERAPESFETLLGKMKAHEALGDLESALDCAARAVALEPSHTDARVHLARYETEIAMRGGAAARVAQPQDPTDELPAFRLLRKGLLKQGFQALAAHYAMLPNATGALSLPTFGREVPRWDGKKADTLVVVLDQGFGDCLQFMRYLSAARAACDRLTVVAYPELHGLLREFDVIDHTALDLALRDADAYIPAMILPAVMDLEYGQPGGYLHAELLPFERPAGLNVGICWAGNPRNATDATRSATVADLEPLCHVDGVTYWSLMQRDADRPEWIRPPPLPLRTYEDTARYIAGLDLVISVDTSVAHLAAAMGKPTWVALADRACWRWGEHPTSTPWYESTFLVRANPGGGFVEVFDTIAAKLENTASPWIVAAPVFTPDECDQILAIVRQCEWSPGRIHGEETRKEHRACVECRLPITDETRWIFEKLSPAAQQADAALGTGASDLQERPIVAVYRLGDHFAWHRDTNEDGTIARRMSVTVQLSPADSYEGGDVVVMAPRGARRGPAVRDQGWATFFRSDCLHAVQPVAGGERAAMVIWFC